MNKIIFVIIILIILIIYYNYYISESTIKTELNNINFEKFNSFLDFKETDLKSLERCQLLGQKKFMIRDIKTQLWLIFSQENGFSKFLPGRFGNIFLMSSEHSDYLPLRTIMNPNDYLLSTSNGNEIKVLSNPTNQYYVIQVFIFNGYNILGYLTERDLYFYLYVNNDGYISSITDPDYASKIEILEI